jgi:hypothetical protein
MQITSLQGDKNYRNTTELLGVKLNVKLLGQIKLTFNILPQLFSC